MGVKDALAVLRNACRSAFGEKIRPVNQDEPGTDKQKPGLWAKDRVLPSSYGEGDNTQSLSYQPYGGADTWEEALPGLPCPVPGKEGTGQGWPEDLPL
jgi:hypothetical protein